MPRIGLLGCGAVSDFGHVPAILSTPGLDLVALYDPSPTHVQGLANKFGLSGAFSNLDEFYDQKLDAVVIASPAPTHLQNALEAATRGCHILCEKPLAMSEEDSIRMRNEVEERGRMLFTAFVYRFSPVAQQIRSWIHQGTVGEIKSLRLIYDWNLDGQYEQLPSGEWIESPRWKERMLEGGPMVDCGVHQIDLARWWLQSEVIHQSSAGAWVVDYAAPDHVYLHMRHESDALTTVEMSFTFGHTVREPCPLFSYHLIGTGGLLLYERAGYLLEARTGSGVIRVPGASEKNFPGMHQAFLHALETGERGDLGSPEDGIVATRIARKATDDAEAARNLSK